MLRPWHAIRPLRREVLCSRLHVPNIENERIRISLLNHRFTSTSTSKSTSPEKLQPHALTDPTLKTTSAQSAEQAAPPKQKHKTIAEADAELLAKLEGISGEGGVAGVEYEGGKAVGLKRGVRDNMFRVI